MTRETVFYPNTDSKGLMSEFGISKNLSENWILHFFIANPHKYLKDVFKSPKFKAQEKHYHLIECVLKNGIKKYLLYFDNVEVYSSYEQLEKL